MLRLNDAGYNKLPRADVSSVTSSTGVPPNIVVMSADPGQAKVINVSSATSEIWARKAIDRLGNEKR